MLGAAVGNGAAAYPPTPAMKRFADSLVRQKGIKSPPGYKTSISICRKFLNEHVPKKAHGETPGKLEPKRSVRTRCRTPRRSRKGKASSLPTRPRPARLPCLRGLNRTEAASAAVAVARLPTSQLVQRRLNRRGRHRGLGNATLAPMLLRRLPPTRIRQPGRHCGFPMATRTSR